METVVGEKFNELPIERQDEIRKQIEQGAIAAKEKSDRLAARRNALRAGREYLASKKLPIIEMAFSGYMIMGAVEWNSDGSGRVAYAVCSPKDSYSVKIGRGLVGLRLKQEPCVFSNPCGEYRTIRGAKAEIMRALLNSCKVPARLFKNFG